MNQEAGGERGVQKPSRGLPQERLDSSILSDRDGRRPVGELAAARGKAVQMAGEDWRRLADYVVARRVELGMRDRRAFAEATGVTERTLGKLENGQRVSPSTLAMVENRLGWGPGSSRRILAGGEPNVGSADRGHAEYEDPTLWHIASTPGLPPDVVRGLVALARTWRQGDDAAGAEAGRRA
jgi:transcriptional regulator with XRE-family HTH domain